MDNELTEYLQRQLSLARQRLRKYVASANGRVYPHRHIFYKTGKYISDFLDGTGGKRWVIIPGLRGTGKTTILAQTYDMLYREHRDDVNYIYLSLDEATETLGKTLKQVLAEYERLLGESYETLSKPTFLLIDEMQSDPNWAYVLKALIDRTENIFIISTGSSAVHLQDTADVTGRRAVVERLFPMNFCEFEMVKNDLYPDKGLKHQLVDTFYHSEDAQMCYDRLMSLKDRVDRYWSQVDRAHWKYYLAVGGLPFVLSERTYADVSDAVLSNMDKVINRDLLQLGKFEQETYPIIKRLLYVLAETEAVSDRKMADVLGINRATLANIYDALVQAEVLIRVPPYGRQVASAKKPTKYLFMSSVIRSAFFFIAGSADTTGTREGRLLEDLAGLHFYRSFGALKHGEVSYDSTQGSADFVYRDASGQIAIEVGRGAKTTRQVDATMKRIECKYGLTICSGELSLSNTGNAVLVPWDFFALS